MISETALKTFFSELIPKDSLVLSSRAPIGYIGVVRKDYVTNQGCKSLICYENQAVNFHYFNFKENVHKLKFLSYGTTFDRISKKT